MLALAHDYLPRVYSALGLNTVKDRLSALVGQHNVGDGVIVLKLLGVLGQLALDGSVLDDPGAVNLVDRDITVGH